MPWFLVLALLGATPFVAPGASTNEIPANASSGQSAAHNKHTIENRPIAIPAEAKSDKEKPLRPNRADKTNPGGAIKELVHQFQSQREQYLQEREALLKKYRTATEAERDSLREQIKESLERFKEMQKQLLQEQKERTEAMRKELQAELGRVIEAGQNESGRR
jgi:hypothetical protein